MRFVSSGYIEVEQLVTYAIPTAEVTVEMDKVPVQSGTIYATAVNTESTALDGVTFEYKFSTEVVGNLLVMMNRLLVNLRLLQLQLEQVLISELLKLVI